MKHKLKARIRMKGCVLSSVREGLGSIGGSFPEFSSGDLKESLDQVGFFEGRLYERSV